MKTPGPYLREKRIIYVLEPTGRFHKGKELLQNRIYVGFQGGPNTPKEEVEATAAYFQMAANCHDEIVVALKAMREYAIPGMNWTDEVGQALLDLADKALTKATEAT